MKKRGILFGTIGFISNINLWSNKPKQKKVISQI